MLTDPRFRVGGCVAGLLLVALAGVLFQPPAPSADTGDPAGRVVVTRTALACPGLGAGQDTRTGTDAAAPVLPDGTPTAGGPVTGLGMFRLGPGAVLGAVRARGRMASTPATERSEPIAVRAEGPLAAGAVATVTSTAPTGVNRGMASAVCVPPSADFWFIGASAGPGRRDVLVLTNLDQANASVDVTLYGRGGVLDSSATKGVVVPGHKQTEVYLNAVARGQRDLALRVVSTGGRVAAAVRDNVAFGVKPAGVDWLPPAAAPAAKVLVPAIPAGGGVRVLTVVNPGTLPASATVTVHGSAGRFKPAGKENLNIPAGGVHVVKLHDVLRGEAAAVSIESDQPLTASARAIDAKYTDFASIGAVTTLTGPAYLALPRHPESVSLLVTAPDGASAIGYEVRDAAGRSLDRRTVDVGAGATVAVPIRPASQPTYLTVTPTEGAVIGGVTLTPPAKPDGPGRMAAWPLTTSRVFQAQLGARPDVRAALR